MALDEHPGYRPYGGDVAGFLAGKQTITTTVGGVADVDVNALILQPGEAVTVWDAAGTQIVDILDDTGAAVTEVTADDEGALPRFWVPDSYTEVFVDGGATRRQVLPVDLAAIPLDGGGIGGTGTVTSVNGESPDAGGNVALALADIPTLSTQLGQKQPKSSLLADVLSVLTGNVPGVRLVVSVTYDETAGAWPELTPDIANSSALGRLFNDFTGNAPVPSQGVTDVDLVVRDAGF